MPITSFIKISLLYLLGDYLTSKASAKPNFVIYIPDDLGHNQMPTNNRDVDLSNVAILAAEGMTLNYTYTVPLCAPSRWRALAGWRYTTQNPVGVRSNLVDGIIPIPNVTLPKAMQSMGYTTAIIGKYGPGANDTIGAANKMGFEVRYLYPTTLEAQETFPTFLEVNGSNIKFPVNDQADFNRCLKGKCIYGPDLFYQQAMNFITNNAHAKPFFLFWTPNIPHFGVFARRPYAYTCPVPSFGDYQDPTWTVAEKGYAASLTYHLNRDIGGLLGLVYKLNIQNNTYIVYASDNGEEVSLLNLNQFFGANAPLRGGKAQQYEGGVRVPAIVWGPGIPAGSTSNYPMDLINLLPTITDLAGGKVTTPTATISYAPIWLKGDASAATIPREPIYIELCLYADKVDSGEDNSCTYSLFNTTAWPKSMLKMLIPTPYAPVALFDVMMDPTEENDLATNPKFAPTIAAMEQERQRLIAGSPRIR